MTEAAVKREFNTDVKVLLHKEANSDTLVGLVETTNGYTVVEIDRGGFEPFFEDFGFDEEKDATDHFHDRVSSLSQGKRTSVIELIESAFGPKRVSPETSLVDFEIFPA